MELLFRDDAYARSCTATVVAAGPAGVRLDRTVFYATGGGQPGDAGRLVRADGTPVPIAGAVYDRETGDVLHLAAEGTALPAPGETVTAELDWARRLRHMRIHTALHLLCAVVPGGVTGGQIGDGRGRLDFDLPDQPLDKEAIMAELARMVAADAAVRSRWITDADLAAQPDLVRTMRVKPPSGGGRVRLIEIDGIDLQPCGGTHVARTGEIGALAVGKIENKGRHNRRINIALAE
ncbi:MAG: alanyl-tRNA editing protein [Alphaproteobacteria bacterium]